MASGGSFVPYKEAELENVSVFSATDSKVHRKCERLLVEILKVSASALSPTQAGVTKTEEFFEGFDLCASDTNPCKSYLAQIPPNFYSAYKTFFSTWISKRGTKAVFKELFDVLSDLEWDVPKDAILNTNWTEKADLVIQRCTVQNTSTAITPAGQDVVDNENFDDIEEDCDVIKCNVDEAQIPPDLQPDGFGGKFEKLVVKVREATEIKEGPDIYKMTSKPRGVALIINNEFRDSKVHGKRSGSEYDVYFMLSLFHQFGFDVYMAQNVKSTMLSTVFKKYRSYLTSKMDAAVVVVMSHGELGKIVMEDDKLVSLHTKILAELSCHKEKLGTSWENKPKLVLIQACQDICPLEWKDSSKEYTYSNVIVGFPTCPDDAAWRNESLGSVFIRIFTEHFMEDAWKDDFDTIAKKVTESMKKRAVQSRLGYQPAKFDLIGIDKKLYFNPGQFK